MFKKILGLFLIGLLSLTACSNNEMKGANLLKASADPKELTVNYGMDLSPITDSINDFAGVISEATFEEYYEKENFVVSPLSIYACLAMCAGASSNNTKTEILNTLNISEQDLIKLYPYLHSSLEKEFPSGMLDLDNSLWLQNGYPFNEEVLDKLAKSYYTTSYDADFKNNPDQLVEIIKNYISEKTKGLLAPNLPVTDETLMVILNTLYIKDIWVENDELKYTNDNYDFRDEDNNITSTKLLMSQYNMGKVYQTDTYSAFYASTFNNFSLTFIKPNDGYNVSDIYNKENISELTDISYGGYEKVDEENYIQYLTRVYFPKFSCLADQLALKDILMELGIKDLFSMYQSDFAELLGEDKKHDMYCSDIYHGAKLEVNEEGIEGGAYTASMMCGSAGPVETIYDDFILDKAFAYILSYKGIVLFSGVVNKI